MRRVLKVGLVGCGQISTVHLDVYSILGDTVKVVGVCDLDPQKARRLADRYRIASAFNSHMDMLEAARPDIVDVCTPSSSHMQIAVDSAKKGCHVLVEKPMARSTRECRSMIHEARKNNVSLCICHDRIFSPSLLMAKKTLEERNLKISLSALRIRTYDPRPWIRDTTVGGILWEQGCHPVYVQRHLLGQIYRVFALSKHVVGSLDETYYILLQSTSGALGFVDLSSWSPRAGTFLGRIDTETGEQVDLDWVSEYFEIKKPTDPKGFGVDWSAKIYDDIRRLCKMRIGYAWKYLTSGGPRFLIGRHLALMRQFVESLNSGIPPVSGQDGLDTVQILEAIESSAERGESVLVLPDEFK